MPCLELKVPAELCATPATRLRALLEKPGAAVLRRHTVAEAQGDEDGLLRNRVRITAVLAVDLMNPPREPAKPAAVPAPEREAADQTAAEEPQAAPAAGETGGSFAGGLEIWISSGVRAACVTADAEEIPGALAMFDAYLRLARYQPAFLRLDQRLVGLTYAFREGLTVGVQGEPSPAEPQKDTFFEAISPIAEIDDFRAPSFAVRLPNAGIGYLHELLQSASAWLEENSYPSILGSH